MKTQNLKDKSKGVCKDKEQEPTPKAKVGGESPVKDDEENNA